MADASASGSRARKVAAVLLIALALVVAIGAGLWVGLGGLRGKPTPQTIIVVLPGGEDPSSTPTLVPSTTATESPSASVTASPSPTRAPTRAPTPLGPVQWFPDGPNLIVASIHLDPADPECDDIFKIIWAVSNIGDAPAGAFSARVSTVRAGHPEMQADYTIPGLEAGRSWGKVVDWTTSHSHCGEAYQVLIEVDYLHDIDESEEGDNIRHLGFVP